MSCGNVNCSSAITSYCLLILVSNKGKTERKLYITIVYNAIDLSWLGVTNQLSILSKSTNGKMEHATQLDITNA